MKKRNQKTALPLLLSVSVLLILLYLVFGRPTEYKELEKSYRAECPLLTGEALFSGEFGTEFEEYLTDRIPPRNLFVGINSYMRLLTNRQNTTEIWMDGAGTLYESPVNRDYTVLNKSLGKINLFADSNPQFNVTLLIVPEAGFISDRLSPVLHSCYKDDVIFSDIKGGLSENVHFTDVTESLLNSDKDCFYRCDHHWNSYGAYLAYKELSGPLGYVPEGYSVSDTVSGFYGTTYSRSGLWLCEGDTIELSDCGCPVSVTFSDDENTYDTLYFTEKYEDSPDKYPLFLDGNHPVCTVKNKKGNTGKNLMIVKDSYAMSLVPFLIKHYDTITIMDLRYTKESVSRIMEENRISDVLILYSLDHMLTDTNIVWLK